MAYPMTSAVRANSHIVAGLYARSECPEIVTNSLGSLWCESAGESWWCWHLPQRNGARTGWKQNVRNGKSEAEKRARGTGNVDIADRRAESRSIVGANSNVNHQSRPKTSKALVP